MGVEWQEKFSGELYSRVSELRRSRVGNFSLAQSFWTEYFVSGCLTLLTLKCAQAGGLFSGNEKVLRNSVHYVVRIVLRV